MSALPTGIMMLQSKPTVQQGDIVLVLFPNSDLRSAKTRLALVVQANHLQTGLEQVIVAMLTSKMTRLGHPGCVPILLNTPEGKQSGLLTDSIVATDNLATIKLSAIARIIGCFPMPEVEQALRHTFGLIHPSPEATQPSNTKSL